MRYKDITGERFGRLLVIRRTRVQGSHAVFLCQCDCGTEKEVLGYKLRRREVRSCGCLARELSSKRERTHGLTKHRLFGIWNSMMNRCANPKNAAYSRYGARGITVCKRWQSVRHFIGDNEHKALPGLTLERRDNDKGYTPSNTYWATRTQQASNRRSNVRLTYEGRTQTLFEWAAEVKIHPRTLWARVQKRGWPIDKALTTPVKKT